MVRDGGVVMARDAATGEEISKHVAAAGRYYASPVAAAGNIYFTSLDDGSVTVIKAGGKTPEVVASNPPLGERVGATPAIAGDSALHPYRGPFVCICGKVSRRAMDNFSTGYCTNVHAGATLAETRANLQRHALAVKKRYSPERPMGVGLWLSAKAAEELLLNHGEGEFGEWLAEHGLVPYTMNGFPFGDFHQQVVKHRVYEPTWWQPERLHYTMQLAQIMDRDFAAGHGGEHFDAADCVGHALSQLARNSSNRRTSFGRPQRGCTT